MSGHRTLVLPEPDDQSLEHSARLKSVINDAIDAAGGLIPFSQFMEIALYSPLGGYYLSGSRKFGEEGDFVTAPELGDVFARCLAKQVAQVLDGLENGEVLEIGAGSGVLAMQLLKELDKHYELPSRYSILEVSPELSRRQFQLLQQRVPEYADRVRWLSELPNTFSGVVVANEVVDALPVDRFTVKKGDVFGVGVAVRESSFADATYAVDHAKWDAIRKLNLADGYSSEVGFQQQAWIRSLGDRLKSGVIIVIDYGFPCHEFFHPQRCNGTLMCHYRHHSHSDPYINVGLQDITAHVDFTALAGAACESGLSLLGFTNQASFLLSLGILDIIAPEMQGNTAHTIEITQQVKKLTLPSEMGELFKVMVVGIGFEQPLLGFALADHRSRL
ncbi:MAG: SAM-dependent methyltransferase [Arenicellales bacterium]|nr:SAM-dependent methyltransferase [Arenicellales bacterium]